ncbi:MAG: hypothetical protein ACQEQC_07900 [Elusimicrobiota bacterium]
MTEQETKQVIEELQKLNKNVKILIGSINFFLAAILGAIIYG